MFKLYRNYSVLVDHVQNPVIGDGNGENLVIPRLLLSFYQRVSGR